MVLRDVVDRTEGRQILLGMGAGRTWNRVAELTSTQDRYELRMPNATVNVRGTTFLADCRTQQVCYVVGFDGTSEVTSSTGVKRSVKDGDCIRATDTGIEQCDEKKLGLIDSWVKENLADDQQLALKRGPSTPRASLSPSPSATSPGTGGTTPVPTATDRPRRHHADAGGDESADAEAHARGHADRDTDEASAAQPQADAGPTTEPSACPTDDPNCGIG